MIEPILTRSMRPPIIGIQKIYRFPNRLGASVIQSYLQLGYGKKIAISFGADQGLWEIAVIIFKPRAQNREFSLYNGCRGSAPAFAPVLIPLTEDSIQSLLSKIQTMEAPKISTRRIRRRRNFHK